MELRDGWIPFLLLLFLLVLATFKWTLDLFRLPISLRYFLCGAFGPLMWAIAEIPKLFHENREYRYIDTWIILGLFLVSPLWFALGTQSSLKDSGRMGQASKWANLAGLSTSIGLSIIVLLDYLSLRPTYTPFLGALIPELLIIGISVFVIAGTNFRRVKWLPRFPAALLTPTVLATFVMFSMHRTYGGNLPGQVHLVGSDGLQAPWSYGWGAPMQFYGVWKEPFIPGLNSTWGITIGFRVAPFLFDLLLAIGVAWLLPLAIEKCLLGPIRTSRSKKQGLGELT